MPYSFITSGQKINICLTENNGWLYSFVRDGGFYSNWQFGSFKDAEKAAKKAVRGL